MQHKGIIEKTISTEIKWKGGCDPTMQKKKKKRKGKKVTVEEKIDSFFNFFKDCDPNPVGTAEDAFNA